MESITVRKTIAADVSLSLADDGAISLILSASTESAAAALATHWRTEADVADPQPADQVTSWTPRLRERASVLRSCAAELEDALGLTEASHASHAGA